MIKIEHKIMLWSVVASLALWLIDAGADVYLFGQGSFLNNLIFDVQPHEFYFRIFFVVSFLLFGFIISRVVARRNQIEEKLKNLSAAMESSMDGIAIYNSNGEYVYVNKSYATVNGYDSPEEIIGRTYQLVYDENELKRMELALAPGLSKSGKWRGELVARRKNGSAYYQEASVTKLEDGGRVCIVRDITWRKRSEERLHRSERFLNTIFDSIRDPFCIFDDEFRIIKVNEAYAHIKNKRIEDLIGRKCYEILEARDAVCPGCVVSKTFDSADPCAKDKHVALYDGTSVWMEIYTYPILDENVKVSHVIEYTRDITERRKSEDEKRRLIEKLEYLSRTDGLTGLINRRALTDSLSYEIDRAKRYGSELSLILCDIDNFKDINDTYGHDSGDRALQTLSATLKSILRKPDIAGRYGGDEFMIVLPETSISGAENLAEKLLFAMRETELRFHDGTVIRLSMSIGVANLVGDREDENIDSLVKRADHAMYLSKHAGRNRISVSKS